MAHQTFNSRHAICANCTSFVRIAPQDCLLRLCIDLTCKSFARFASGVNAPLECGLFSLLHCGEDTAVCVTKRERSETVALLECEREKSSTISTSTAPNIHRPLHKLPRLSHTSSPLIRRIPVNCRVPAYLKFTFHNFKTVNTLTFLK